jgi:hypothetical protein
VTYSVTYDPLEKIITIAHQGIVNAAYVKEVVEKTVQLVIENQCFKILSDFRKAKLGLSIVGMLETQKLIGQALDAKDIPTYKVRRALLVRKINLFNKDFSFFETVSVNRAQNVKLFSDPEKALEWLKKE